MRHIESTIQINCVRWFRYQYRHLSRLLFAVPNGGARDAATGRILKAEGVVPGAADLLLLVPSGLYHGLCIEMKTPTGRQQASQYEFEKAVKAQGYKYVICRSVDDFICEVQQYLTY